MTSHSNVEARVSEFKHAQTSPEAARNFVQHLQDDAIKNGGQAKYDRFAHNELDPMTLEMRGTLPNLRIAGLTAEASGQHKGGVVLKNEGGGGPNVVIFNEKGKYVEAEKTKDGYIEHKNGKEFEIKDGKLTEKPHHEEKATIPTPETHLTWKQRESLADGLIDLVKHGDEAKASALLRKLSPEDAREVGKRMQFNHHMNAQADSSITKPLHLEMSTDSTGRPYPVGVRIATPNDKEYDDARATAEDSVMMPKI